MTWVAVAVGAGSVVTGYLGSQSAKKASGAAQQGSAQAIAESQRQFDLVRGDTAGQRFVGAGATNALSRLYGYGPVPTMQQSGVPAGAAAYQPNLGGSASSAILKRAISPKTALRGAFDPVGATIGSTKFFAGLLGSKHGDEKRNLKAFTSENQIYDLGDGKLALGDGTVFTKEDLEGLAGAWYGAKYAPDGNQAGWQRTYDDTVAGLVAKNGRTAEGSAQAAAPGAGPAAGKPDMGAFFESPDYQFNLAEGQKAIDRSLAARGGALSGGGVREGVRYASGMASREYSGFVDRLLQQAGLGATGIAASANAGANTAANVGNAAMNAGNARASAYMQGGAAINNSVQGGVQNLLLMKYLGG